MTASVTPCSTCSRVLTSRNANSPESASSTNSTVPAERYWTGSSSAPRRVEQRARAPRRRDAARASPRSPSDAVAAWSSRVRRARRPCPSPSPNACTSMWRASPTNRSRNTAAMPNACSLWRIARSTTAGRSAVVGTTSMPIPPPPATLFTSNGIARSALGFGHRLVDVRRRQRPSRQQRDARGRRRDARLVLRAEPSDLIGRGPDEDEAGVLHRRREPGVLGEEPVARDAPRRRPSRRRVEQPVWSR